MQHPEKQGHTPCWILLLEESQHLQAPGKLKVLHIYRSRSNIITQILVHVQLACSQLVDVLHTHTLICLCLPRLQVDVHIAELDKFMADDLLRFLELPSQGLIEDCIVCQKPALRVFLAWEAFLDLRN